jgi:hypothetical protein
MDSRNMSKVAARRADIAGHASADEGTDLVIVVLNELACTGNARGRQFCTVDYAGMYPAAAAA